MEVLKVIILGIIQGITEWLPVSSTGHMLLFDELMPLHQSAEFVSVFMVVVQLGSVLAVVVLFFRKLWPFGKEKSETRRTLTLWGKVLIASIPAGAAGLLFDDVIDSRLSVWPVIAAALALYGIAYIILEKCVRIRTRINSVDELLQIVDALSERAGICLDTGHAHMCGHSIPDFIHRAGDYLIATHIADNNGHKDEHLLPFFGTIDWESAMKAFNESYKGYLNYECMYFGKAFPQKSGEAIASLSYDIANLLLSLS